LGQQKWLLLIYVCGTVTLALLLIGGIEMFGTIGAVWGTLITAAFFGLTRLLVLRQLSPQLWISPLSVFRIEEFDRRLWRILKP
jgi:O-antigen/teichoic acid export membrane protein